MYQRKLVVLIFILITLVVGGCSGVKRRAAETQARGTIETGGYTWKISADSEGGNTIRAHGLPGRQAATDASSQLCKKYDRIAQVVRRKPILLIGAVKFDFNCVR